MKVSRSQPRQLIRSEFGARFSLACAATVLLLAAGIVRAQSPGMSALLQAPGHPGLVPQGESAGADRDRARHDAAQRSRRTRTERDAAVRRGLSQGSLSFDERRRLRQNLYELSREMYKGG